MKIIECPRDAMQGIKTFIPTEDKIRYIQELLAVGFDTIDFGSFVSPKAIPQMRDTEAVVEALDLSKTKTQLLAIVPNKRGALQACEFEQIKYLGYPFSISETFQQRNTNASIEDSLLRIEEITNLCKKHNKSLNVYLSMGFGNPYGDPFSVDILLNWAQRLHQEFGIELLSISDTIGVSKPPLIHEVFTVLNQELPEVEIGAHLHSTPETCEEKIAASIQAGCKRFDVAIKGFGGCPMAKDDLTGNMISESLMGYLEQHKIKHNINMEAFNKALISANEVFPIH